MTSQLYPTQLVFGISRDAEAAAVMHVITPSHFPRSHGVPTLDFSKAFNDSVFRDLKAGMSPLPGVW